MLGPVVTHTKTLSCRPTWQCIGNNQDGQSRGRVFCIKIVVLHE